MLQSISQSPPLQGAFTRLMVVLVGLVAPMPYRGGDFTALVVLLLIYRCTLYMFGRDCSMLFFSFSSVSQIRLFDILEGRGKKRDVAPADTQADRHGALV